MGTYTAFFDLGIAIASPALGLIASALGLQAVFLVSALIVLAALAITIRLCSIGTLGTSSPAATMISGD